MPDFAARIRAARAYAGLTQGQLAKRLGTSVQTIKRREKGEIPPSDGELLAIAAICGVPASFMERGFGEAEPSEILARLERIETALAGGDLEPMRDYARALISELAEAAGDSESAAPTAPLDRDPGREAR